MRATRLAATTSRAHTHPANTTTVGNHDHRDNMTNLILTIRANPTVVNLSCKDPQVAARPTPSYIRLISRPCLAPGLALPHHRVIGMNVSAQEEELRQAIALLDDDDILALCYAFQGKVDRLRLYLDVLRKRSGYRAQFSSCLLCFDLARQGDTSCQREFLLLAETIRYLGQDQALVNSLLGNTPYLIFVWDLCKASLAEIDPLAANSLPQPDPHLPVARLPLFDDSDFNDFRVKTDDVTMWRRFDEAVEAFLGGVLGVPIYDQAAGFRQNNKKRYRAD